MRGEGDFFTYLNISERYGQQFCGETMKAFGNSLDLLLTWH